MILRLIIWGSGAALAVLAVRWLVAYSVGPDSQNGSIPILPGFFGFTGISWHSRDTTVGAYARRTKEIMQERDHEIEWWTKTHPTTEVKVEEAVPETRTETTEDPWRYL